MLRRVIIYIHIYIYVYIYVYVYYFIYIYHTYIYIYMYMYLCKYTCVVYNGIGAFGFVMISDMALPQECVVERIS